MVYNSSLNKNVYFCNRDKRIEILKGLHPGLFIQRELSSRKLKSGAFAESIGEHPQTLSAIIRGRRSMNTSLSLRYGHRMSDDIDLFTDAEYGSLDFHQLQEILRKEFPYCQGDCGDIVGFGASYIVGNSKDDCVKLDLFYTDPFIRPMEQFGTIRMAAVEDIVAMV